MTLKRYAELLRNAAAARAPLSDEARASVLETIEAPAAGWAALDDPRAIAQPRWHMFVPESGGAHAQDIVTGKVLAMGDIKEDARYSTVEIPPKDERPNYLRNAWLRIVPPKPPPPQQPNRRARRAAARRSR